MKSLLSNLIAPVCFLALFFAFAEADAEPILGKCQDAQFGVSRDGNYVYRFSQASFSDEGQISVYRIGDHSVRQGIIGDLPIRNRLISGIVPPWDNRVDESDIFFFSGNQTVSVFSLKDAEIRSVYSYNNFAANGNSVLTYSAKIVNGSSRVKLRKWVPLPVIEKDLFDRAMNLTDGRVVRLNSRNSGFYSIPVKMGYLNLLVGRERSCFTSSSTRSPICFAGQPLEIAEADDKLIVRFEEQLLEMFIDDRGLHSEKIFGSTQRIQFDIEEFNLRTESGTVPSIILRSTSSLLFDQATSDENTKLIMIASGGQSALLLHQKDEIATVSIVQNDGTALSVCD